MILLMQKLKYPPEGWEDMNIPPMPGATPTRGERPKVCDALELADVLCKGEVDGVFRIVMQDGSMHQIEVTTKQVYVAEIRRLV